MDSHIGEVMRETLSGKNFARGTMDHAYILVELPENIYLGFDAY